MSGGSLILCARLPQATLAQCQPSSHCCYVVPFPVPPSVTFQPFSISKAAKRETCAKLWGSQEAKLERWMQYGCNIYHSWLCLRISSLAMRLRRFRLLVRRSLSINCSMFLAASLAGSTFPWLAFKEQVNSIGKHRAFGPCCLKMLQLDCFFYSPWIWNFSEYVLYPMMRRYDEGTTSGTSQAFAFGRRSSQLFHIIYFSSSELVCRWLNLTRSNEEC